jgi:hypothetical protein
MSSSIYATAPDDMLAEIIREAEARLAAQLTAAIAADQRAMTFAGLMLAAAAALTGAALSASPQAVLTLPIIVSALGLFLTSALAVASARPVAWDYVGNEPSCWLRDINPAAELKLSLAEMADHYDGMIKDNEAAIAARAFWLRLSMGSALVSILVGLALAIARLA